MRMFALLFALFFAPPLAAETVRLGDRYYDITRPADPQGAPLILVLHGGGGNPDRTARLTGFTGPAVRKGYAVVYPAGTGRRLLSWNAGYCCASASWTTTLFSPPSSRTRKPASVLGEVST
jgi:polyhydroxybutyrate depolymerase